MPWNGIVDGNPSGITVDILNTSTSYGAPHFNFELGIPWRRAQEMILNMNNGELVLIVPLTRTPTREATYNWIAPLVKNEMNIVSLTTEKITTLAQAKNKHIGVIRGWNAIPYLEKLGFRDLEEAKDGEKNMAKLMHHHIEGVGDSTLVARYQWKKIGGKSEHLYVGPNISESTYIYVAGNHSFPKEVAQTIYAAVEKMKNDGVLGEIINKWEK
ncbi:substrate-binding periplasmic protein [Vibrio algarum]|uniref:Transporter substrate-binding domain-containing protein n=1 Tax=Vibrio algarum TaxID=3020714 RepID=A0ABT4YXG4_9VIBR|nr:transporter substrate-binding domain-containing protein [Vibrio sp. KJ40-1]MDB1125668.1 transporter substrate-binding domain-containing protein [Vibrio sp. KJ40-1]